MNKTTTEEHQYAPGELKKIGERQVRRILIKEWFSLFWKDIVFWIVSLILIFTVPIVFIGLGIMVIIYKLYNK